MIEQGRLRMRRRDADEARRLLAEARGLAMAWGFADEVRRAEANLATLG